MNKIKILSIKLNNEKIKKIYSNKKIENIDLKKIKRIIPIDKETYKIIKKLNLKIEKLKLSIKLGIENTIITSYIVTVISSILSVILPNFVERQNISNIKYDIKPEYNVLTFNMSLDSIISIKVVHIIYVIFNLIRKGREKYERASNRRSYDYSNEFN